METVAAVETAMAEARRARGDGDVVRAEQLLADAHAQSMALDADHVLRAVVGWRHLKALFDLGQWEALETTLARVLELPEPFAEGSGLRAAEPVARGLWDHAGYGRASVRHLWTAYEAFYAGQNDPWMAACGRAQRLWDEACAGELEAVREAIDAIACTTPRRFAGGLSRHPQAVDAATSLFYAQIEQARIGCWAALWAEDAALARLALELYADALAEAELPEDYWFTEAQARSELRFGWSPEAMTRWPAAAASLDHPRAAFHRALCEAELDPSRGRAVWVPGVPLADAAGPEWGVDLRCWLLQHGAADDQAQEEQWREEAVQMCRRFGLGVFRHRLQAATASSLR